jgi:hypothetical protein
MCETTTIRHIQCNSDFVRIPISATSLNCYFCIILEYLLPVTVQATQVQPHKENT